MISFRQFGIKKGYSGMSSPTPTHPAGSISGSVKLKQPIHINPK